MIKIAVIVPVYNTNKKQLVFCIQSLLNQDYDDFLVIIVNDGSTNVETISVLESYSNEKKVYVLNVANGGAPKARNIGIKWSFNNFCPDAFMFVDADDYVAKDTIKVLANLYIKYKADIIITDTTIFNSYSFYDNCENIFNVKEFNTVFCDKSKGLLNLSYRVFPNLVMGKLFDAHILKECLFKEHMRFADDTSFLYRAFNLSNKNIYADFVGYFLNRIDGEESICRTSSLKNSQVLSAIEANIDILAISQLYEVVTKDDLNAKDILNDVAVDGFFEWLPRFNRKLANESLKKQYKNYYKIIRKTKCVVKFKPYNKKSFCKKWAFLLFPRLFVFVYKIYIKKNRARYSSIIG